MGSSQDLSDLEVAALATVHMSQKFPNYPNCELYSSQHILYLSCFIILSQPVMLSKQRNLLAESVDLHGMSHLPNFTFSQSG